MGETIKLLKGVYSKDQFEKIVDVSFPEDLTVENTTQPTLTVDEFFKNYYLLFYDIPKVGTKSHETLIKTSLDYVGEQPNQEVENLLGEINNLQQTILSQQQTIYSLTISGSNG